MGIASCVWLVDDTVTLEEYVPSDTKQVDNKEADKIEAENKEIDSIENSTIAEPPKVEGSRIARTIPPVGKGWPKKQKK